MFFENNNYLDMLINADNMNNYSYSTNTMASDNLSEKFLRGNMFDSEFIPYKNMIYVTPKLKSQKERDLAKLMEKTFEVVDYNLYLDVYPDDMDMLKMYNDKTVELEALKKEYEQKYGPLCMTKGGYNTYKWIESPWPWEKEDGKYV